MGSTQLAHFALNLTCEILALRTPGKFQQGMLNVVLFCLMGVAVKPHIFSNL
jgi:hypothetical protein